MAGRAQNLAERFAQANRELLEVAERCSDEQWRADCQGEGRSVGTLVHHVAAAHGLVMGMTQGLAEGVPLPPVTWDAIHGMNAQHAQENVTPDQAETLTLLRRADGEIVRGIRELSDEQLDRASPWGLADDASLTAEQLIERHMIGHARGHLATIREAVGASA